MTVKEQLWEVIQREGRLDAAGIEELGKKFGLNGHDLAKNLEQLGKDGRATVLWKGSRMYGVRSKRRPGTISSRVYNWLAGRNVMGAWIDVTPKELREALGEPFGPNAVSVAISDLLRQGSIEARRAENGRNITGLRIPLARPPIVVVDQNTGSTTVSENGATNGASAELPPPVPGEVMPATPNLDAYFSARRIARLAPAHNPYITIEFTENPIAEEALVLRERLARALER